MKTEKPETAEQYRALILQFIASLTLCDHMGDVSNDVGLVLEALGLDPEWDDWSELTDWCGQQGITTLYGTSLRDDEEENA